MGRGILLGRLFGTDIYASLGFFVLLGLYFFLYGADHVAQAALLCLAIVVSLLVHEFGHVYAVRKSLGAESVILLWTMGGLCIHPPAPRPGQQVFISLMGPAFEAVLAGAFLAAYLTVSDRIPAPWNTFVYFMVWINLVWLGLNLLPVLPLDGGQALRAALSMKIAPERATAITRRLSLLVAGAGAAVAFSYGYMLAGVLALLLLMENLQSPSPRI